MRPILTMDFETDPFEHLRVPKPFACGLYDGKDFDSTWGPDCADKMVKRLAKLEPSIIYMHNGGRFDIFYLMDHIEAELRIINGRIVQCHLGKHEFRDSYSILPMALKQYKKDDIDITKLESGVRNMHRAEILSYLRGDCLYLHELVTGFVSEFGDFLTIGSASMNQLRKFHPFQQTGKYQDEKFRKQFFFGGRVQCFKSGIIEQEFKIYDVNSMYPFVMRNCKHPTGGSFSVDRMVTKKTAFIVAEGYNDGAFPLRTRKGINFTTRRGEFSCTIHEWNAAIAHGFFRPTRVLKTYQFDDWISFGEFVDHFVAAKVKAELGGDKIRRLFYKFILNSAYGKFAQNPDNFQDWAISHRQAMPEPWQEHYVHADGEYVIWKKPVKRHSYYNVCIGASITGAARSTLMHAIGKAVDPIYVDTDSIICSGLRGVNFSDTELGAWKLEAEGSRLAIAGKKLYACFDSAGTCVKKATKGAKLSAAEIVRVAQGEKVVYRNAAPTFKLNGQVDFIERKIRRTA